MNKSETWSSLYPGRTPEERRCLAESVENANASTWDGVLLFSEEYYGLCLSAFEYLMDTGMYADVEG